jgi:hypothetical protein
LCRGTGKISGFLCDMGDLSPKNTRQMVVSKKLTPKIAVID